MTFDPAKQIRYRECKYVLVADYRVATMIYPLGAIVTRFVTLSRDGVLLIREGFAWDGPSGPTQDDPDTLRASLVHDGLYFLLREGHIDVAMRHIADKLLRDILREDQTACGISPDDGRAAAWLAGLSLFAHSAAMTGGGDPVLVAPRDYMRVSQAPPQD